MTTETADAVLDEVMMLGIELAAVAKPRDPQRFVALLQRFAHAIIREAFEHQEEVRVRLGMPRPFVTAADVEAGTAALLRDLGAIDDSTGAAAVVPNAAQAQTAASETPAAPSNSVLPAAEHVAAAPSNEGADSVTGGAGPVAEPAPSQAEGVVGTALSGDGAGAAPDAGAPARERPHRRIGAPPKLDDQQKAHLNRDYRAARTANGGTTPRGWVAAQMRRYGVSNQTIYRALEPAMTEILTGEVAPRAPRTATLCRAEKPVSQHAAPRTPEPRVWRLIGTRY